MKRRNFIASTSAAALAASDLSAAETSDARPNLLIIHCDELNFRTLGCYRDTLPAEQAFMWGPDAFCPTPFIDSLAEEGALWTGCYPATPVCSPSRSTFLTGRFPQNTPVTNNNTHLADDAVTFAELLSRAGYHTGYAGKWHLDGIGKPQWEPEREFGFQDNRHMFNRGHWKQFEDTPDGPRVKSRNQRGEPDYSVKGADEESFATDWLSNKAMEYMSEHQDEPWAYMLSIPDPHGPDTVRAPYDSMFSDDHVQKPRTWGKDPDASPEWGKPIRNCPWKMASYHGMMKCIDDNVGKMLAHLKSLDILDQTIVIFTADHGDMRGEHGRQNKNLPYEASAKVPFVIRYPEKIASGQLIHPVFNTVDFLPTILPLMGVGTAGLEEGRDLSGLMAGEALEGEDITWFRSTTSKDGPGSWAGAVTPRFKLLLSPKEKPWLLDREADPDELENHIHLKKHREVVQSMARSIREYALLTGDSFYDEPRVKRDLARLIG